MNIMNLFLHEKAIIHLVAVTNDDIRILYQLYDQTLLKALDLIDKGCIELITILDSDRQYFSVQGSNSFYTLYLRVNFCECFMFKFNVEKKEKHTMCKHILACHLALALGKYKTRTATSFVISDPTQEKPD